MNLETTKFHSSRMSGRSGILCAQKPPDEWNFERQKPLEVLTNLPIHAIGLRPVVFDKIINVTKRFVKGAGLTAIGLLMYSKAAQADFFAGRRPPAKYSVQVDMRYDGSSAIVTPKFFGSKIYGFAATNLSAEKLRPYLGVGYIGKVPFGKNNAVHFMPTLEFDTASGKLHLTNYATLTLADGKYNIDNVVSVGPGSKVSGSVSAGIDVYYGLRIGAVVDFEGKVAARIWTNNKDVNWIAGATISKGKIQGNLRVHF